MSSYRAPLRDMQFVLRELAGVDEIAKLPGLGDTPDVLDAILDEASSFASGVLDPINRTVIGGRDTGVGVGGFTLGGKSYSFPL